MKRFFMRPSLLFSEFLFDWLVGRSRFEGSFWSGRCGESRVSLRFRLGCRSMVGNYRKMDTAKT